MAIIKNIILDLGNVILKGTHMSIIKQYATNAEQMKFIEEEYLKAKECLFIDDDDTNQSYITANKLEILGRRVEPNSEKDIIKLLAEFNIKI